MFLYEIMQSKKNSNPINFINIIKESLSSEGKQISIQNSQGKTQTNLYNFQDNSWLSGYKLNMI